MTWFKQAEYDVRFEWGLDGARRLSSDADVSIVVDVLSFSTCVDVATTAGARVYPYIFKDERAKEYARDLGGICAEPQRSKDRPCLSPRTLRGLEPKSKLVLPSPNGSTISFSIESRNLLCGCLRNAEAVAKKASLLGKRILVIAAGEQWDGGGLRPALEDMIGAGAILSCLSGTKSPETVSAEDVFMRTSGKLLQTLQDCSSGRELRERGFSEDIDCAAELNVSSGVPVLTDKYFHLGE